MTAFLMTWKISGWPYSEVKKLINDFDANGFAHQEWRIKSYTQCKIGDRGYLFKQGKGETGIFGCAVIDGEPRKASKGESAEGQYLVPLRITRLVDPTKSLLMTRDMLEGVLPENLMNSQASGIPFEDGLADIIDLKLSTSTPYVIKISDDTKKKISGNPDWTKDETILALDLYFQHPEARNSKTHSAMIELSNLLRSLPVHPEEEKGPDFRNVNGIGMKLQNLKSHDPTYPGVGLKRGAKIEQDVWDEFSGDPKKLHEAALAIQENMRGLTFDEIKGGISDDEEAIEGRILTITHQRRERDPRIVRLKKEKVLQETGKLQCEACGFDFKEAYGEIGSGFIECHHEKPVSQLKAGETTKIKELKVLCANCHRMVHKSKPWLSLEELRSLLGRKQASYSSADGSKIG